MFTSLFAVILGLCYCSKESSQSILGRPKLSGPSEALLKSAVDFQCELKIYPENETILLQIFNEGNRDRLLGEYSSWNGQIASIPILIKPYHDGNLECVAMAQNNSNIEPNVSYPHYLKVIVPVKRAKIVVRSGPVVFFAGKTLELGCDLTAGNYVSYKWLLNGRLVSQSHLRYATDDRLIINRTTFRDSGSYMCVATNQFNNTEVFTSNSSEVVITVKDVVSTPDISFTVLKEDSHNYSAVITCQSTIGTPPVTFSLYNRTELVANRVVERNVTFKIPLVFDRHLGWLQCQANNGDQTAYSQWLPLEVVPVGGPVMLHYDYDVGENHAVISLTLYCKAAKGSLPRYQWFLNETLLHGRGSFYHVTNQPPEQSILLLSVGRSSAGTYHCKVSDSFDNTTAISSQRLYIEKQVLNRLPVLVVAIVFGCFTALVLLVTICCCFGAMFRRQLSEEKSLLNMEMKGTVAAHDELDVSEYNEDADVVEMAKGGEFDQESDASVDEWPQIEEEKKMWADEPVEEP